MVGEESLHQEAHADACRKLVALMGFRLGGETLVIGDFRRD